MAPDFTTDLVSALPDTAIVLDPMMGSGSFPVAAARTGRSAIGFDTDPLAVIIATTSAGQFDRERFLASAARVVKRAAAIRPFETPDPETAEFVSYWFDSIARNRLGRLVSAIGEEPSDLKPMLWCAFSRLVVTKEAGASLARDVSHSRPHRVRVVTSFDPLGYFQVAARTIVRRLPATSEGAITPRLELADARSMPLPDRSVDAVLTSPPYLSAIDYLRGHRLALVWMGYTVSELRALRGENIGSERGIRGPLPSLTHQYGAPLPDRDRRQLGRYVRDIQKVMTECFRVLRKDGALVMIVGSASLAGRLVPLPELVIDVARTTGFALTRRTERPIATDRRYLPPPDSTLSSLSGRLRSEAVLDFAID